MLEQNLLPLHENIMNETDLGDDMNKFREEL